MIKLHLDVSDVIHTNEHTEHVHYGLYVNFWSFLLLWPHVPIKIIFLTI